MDYRPKKRFGQNFLKSEHVVERILAAADLAETDRVLEIGPGLGALTDRILPLINEMTVMEVDRDLAARLSARAPDKLTLHLGDALRLDWDALLTAPPYKLVANLPYNISSQILFKVLDHRRLFRRLVLMFQKEVGDRLCASPGTKDYGILSVLCQVWFDVKRVVNVPPGAFSPPPKVDSVVLSFEPLPEPRVVVTDEALFRRVVKGAFAQRRKTLRNTLKASGFGDPNLEEILLAIDIDPVRRGETLSLEEFARLAQALGKNSTTAGQIP
ncbi:dimethyladenosine transferase [Desulfuromonas soudanensis]|uniref:Ribosomal RNA small subunit methyltransferase A n=1 Tax=Desulfuromonas soudanensis TaxID=1603606 RepID=A0A0M4D276_9BACT|nr:16S rRNA (adenine(1518)-N(6)/adenine(1519)-N(6))-dimethyltransferase RsmA [Desulfuromonas soudanensis]ALC16364.1 dimethyladenosine transferase [Desulfuromonas soudanensis]